MSNVHSSRVVEGEGDNAFRLELPPGILNALVDLHNEEVEEDDKSDEDIDDGAEDAEEPAVAEDGVFTINEKKDWDELEKGEDKTGIRKLVFKVEQLIRELRIEQFPDLEEIVIRSSYLRDVRDFVVTDCDSLTEIHIGTYCLNGKDNKKNCKKEFRISDCPLLKTITVGEHSCCYFSQCIVDSDSIEEFVFGDTSFTGCKGDMLFTNRVLLPFLMCRK